MVAHKDFVADKGKGTLREGDWHMGIAEKGKREKGTLWFRRAAGIGVPAMVSLLNGLGYRPYLAGGPRGV